MTALLRSGSFTPLLFISVVALSGSLWAYWFLLHDVTETSALLFTRYTARVSFCFFLPVFALGALHELIPSGITRYLMSRRRQLGLAFAFAHLVHLVGIVLYFSVVDAWFTGEDAPAIIIYLLIGLMAITSNSLSMRRLKSGWRVLHKIGLYGVFIGFFTTYLGRVQGYAESTYPPDMMDPFEVYVVLLVLVTGAWLLRITVFWKKRMSLPGG